MRGQLARRHATEEDSYMTATRRAPPPFGATETNASHEVMDLVRRSSELSLLVVQLREAGKSWRDVKAAIEAEIERTHPGHD
jgi:hypothetical protein